MQKEDEEERRKERREKSVPSHGVAETLFHAAFQIIPSHEHLSALLFTNHTVALSSSSRVFTA
jgi:hypothetical protein